MSNDDKSNNPFAQGGANPFGAAPRSPQAANPFAPSSQQARSPLNSPLAGAPSAQPDAASALGGNPFGGGATPAPANPFAVQQGAPSPLTANVQPQAQLQVNAFEAPLKPTSNAGGMNVFAQPEPEPQYSAGGFGDGSFSGGFEDQGFGESADADEFSAQRNLAPLQFAPSEISVNTDFVLPEMTQGMIKKSTAVTAVISMAGIALLFGFLFGFLIDQRQEHNRRVDEWAEIEKKLKTPLEQVATLDAAIPDVKTLQKWISTRTPIKREDVDKLPVGLQPIAASILAPYEALDPSAMKKLGELVLGVNQLFIDAKEHRARTLAISFRRDGKKPFSDYKLYAINLGPLANRRSLKLKGVLHYIKTQQAPRIVAVQGESAQDLKKSKLTVVGADLKESTVSDDDLLPIAQSDLLGFGVTPLALYHQKLIKLRTQLNRLKVTQNAFDRKLQERLKEEKVFTF